MKAMVLERPGTPLKFVDRPDPTPRPGEIRLRVEACAVCRTDLHVVDGDLPRPKLPLVPGHEIVGIVDLIGEGVSQSRLGQRVGVPWLGHTCGHCPIVSPARRIFAICPFSPATHVTAASPVMSLPTSVSPSISMPRRTLCRWRRSCALD
ncbi:hypothetical protein MPL3365_230159 [Mesorhizobium plurifarium]|uniref:Alcohol dehydrogenase-like N-terminal domain-containing protein n=1 Tax=Mesorhizobium plurifarium TaxID=69974 RepID=A0A090GB38_MESPL|nr:hypothetical protein MPL3365_230159 [Mesorhizobium plurifarium]